MAYKSIKCGGDVVKVMNRGVIVWEMPPIQLHPDVRFGDNSNLIHINIAVPTDKNGYTEITLNFEWLIRAELSDIEFKLSDDRWFGWWFKLKTPNKYGSNDGVSGSPTTKIKIENLDKPISNISIKCAFSRPVGYDDLKNISVTADYVIQ